MLRAGVLDLLHQGEVGGGGPGEGAAEGARAGGGGLGEERAGAA